MPSSTVRRYRRKHLARIDAKPPDKKAREAARLLVAWQAEARRQARSLGAPAVWALARNPNIQVVAHHLDESGGLQAELNRVCAEAIAEVAGRHLVRVSRPLADRTRRDRPETAES